MAASMMGHLVTSKCCKFVAQEASNNRWGKKIRNKVSGFKDTYGILGTKLMASPLSNKTIGYGNLNLLLITASIEIPRSNRMIRLIGFISVKNISVAMKDQCLY